LRAYLRVPRSPGGPQGRALQIIVGGGAAARAGHGNGVDGAVVGSVAAAVESVPHGAAPRLSRCRTVWPLLACRGLVPARAANAASLRQRPGWEKDTMAWAALTGPMPRRSVRPGATSSTMA
jgi:hypothetical protein